MVFEGRYASLAKIAEFVRKASKDAGLDDFAAYMVETAVDEACSNIIEHAYQGEDNGNIEVTTQPGSTGLKIILRDHGQPFDPQAVDEPDKTLCLEDQPGHGLGLYFIRQWMDVVQFDFSPDRGNVLTMIKYREKKE